MAGEEKLRDEIIAFEAARQQLTLWKIVGLGALAAIGLGVEGSSKQSMLIILGLIPLFTAYCDLINSEYEIRIALVAAFFRNHDGFFKEYESFLELDKVRETNWWEFVKGVNKTPSYFACFLVFIIGLCIILSPKIITLSLVANEPLSTAIVLMVSAVMGAFLTHYIDNLLDVKRNAILNIGV